MAKNFSDFLSKDLFETDDYLVGYRNNVEYKWKLEVSALPSAVVDLQQQGVNVGGNYANWFIMGDGSVRVTGYNSANGEGGTGSKDAIYQPRMAAFNPPLGSAGAGEKVIKLYSQGLVTYAVTSTGSVYGAGYNAHYQLGLGDTVNRNIFTRILRPAGVAQFDPDDRSSVLASAGDKVVSMAVGSGLGYANLPIFARTQQGKLYAWGFNGNTANTSGRLGLGTTQLHYTQPFEIPQSYFGNQAVTKVVTAGNDGYTSTYVLTSNGKVYVTGENYYGQLSVGSVNILKTWTQVTLGLPSNYTAVDVEAGGEQVSSNLNSTAWIILNNGTLYGAGYNNVSQARADGTTAASSRQFTQIGASLGQDFFVRKVVAHCDSGQSTVFALCSTNANGPYRIYGWGSNTNGPLGTGDYVNKLTPTQSVGWGFGTSQTVKQVAVGGNDQRKVTLVLDSNNYLWSSGYGALGNLGTGALTTRNVFRRIPISPALGTPVKVITTNNGAETQSSLVLLSTGKVLAWGFDSTSYGQLGIDASPKTSGVPSYVQMIG